MLVVIKTYLSACGVYTVEQFQALLPYLAWISLPCITRLHKTRLRCSINAAPVNVVLISLRDRRCRLFHSLRISFVVVRVESAGVVCAWNHVVEPPGSASLPHRGRVPTLLLVLLRCLAVLAALATEMTMSATAIHFYGPSMVPCPVPCS